MENLLPDTRSEKKKETFAKMHSRNIPLLPVSSHLKSTACFEVSSLLDSTFRIIRLCVCLRHGFIDISVCILLLVF